MNKKITTIVSLNFVLSLLFGGSFVYAGVSEVLGNGDIAPSVLTLMSLSGDKEKLQEDHWIRAGETGGISDFNVIKEYKTGTSVELEGKALAGTNDYLFNFDLKKEGLGAIIFEFKQFRKYYDGSGGFYAPFRFMRTLGPDTERALFLDIGNLKVEGVLAKENQPKTTVSYEREYRKGTKSLISWGPVSGVNYAGTTLTRYILPTFLETDEIVDKINMKIEHTIKGVDVSAEQAWEKIRVESQKCNNRTLTLGNGAYSLIRYKYEDLDSDIYTTTVRASKELNEKVFFSTALLYNYYRGHTIETITDTSTSSFNENNPNSPANVHQNTITFLPKLAISLAKNLLMDLGFRYEFVNKQGEANYNRDKTNPPDGTLDEIMIIKTETNENKIGESIDLKYDGIKNVVFFAGANFEQQARRQDEKQDSIGSSTTNSNNFGSNRNIISYDYDCNAGAKWYPVSKVNITADFRYKYALRDFDNGSKINQIADVQNGYRGYLDDLALITYKPIITANYKPFRWFAYTFRYILDDTIYAVSTRRGDDPEYGKYLAHIYSTGVTFTPYDYLYMTFFYQKKDAFTRTRDNNDGGRGGVENLPLYNGSSDVLSASCGYSPVKNITIRSNYSLSLANNFNDYSNSGLPLGLDNFSQDASVSVEKKICADCLLELKYDFMQYDETSNGGIDDYEAHLLYADLKMKF